MKPTRPDAGGSRGRDARDAEVDALERERQAAGVALAQQAQLTDRVSRLYLMSSAFSGALTREQVARSLVAHAAVFGPTSGAGVYLLAGDTLELEAGLGIDEAWTRIPLSRHSPASAAVKSRMVISVASTGQLHDEYGIKVERETPQQWIVAPLVTDTEVLGVIALRFNAGEQPLGQEIDFVRLGAELATQAFERARMYDAMARKAEFEHRLLATVGHDLRTPLSAIFSATHILKMKYPEEPVLERLKRSGERMAELIEDIMGRSAAISIPPAAPTPVDLADAVGDAVQELRAAFPSHEIRLRSSEATDAYLNPSRVTQALTNLVRNAVEHGAPDRPVTVTLEGTSSHVTLSVHNEGPPIERDAVSSLFDPFRRGRLAGGRGSGLGLFIVHELVTGLGGRVTVESDEAGTRFTLELPRRPKPCATPR
ncbi:MAG: ATP-binding protein [Sandaracinaceae bacterium]